MPLTTEEKKKCAALFEIYSGIQTEPYRWNDHAAETLSEMIDRLKNCSDGIASLYAVIPRPYELRSLEGLKEWLMRIPVDIIEAQAKIRKGEVVSKICSDAGLRMYTQIIQVDLMR